MFSKYKNETHSVLDVREIIINNKCNHLYFVRRGQQETVILVYKFYKLQSTFYRISNNK